MAETAKKKAASTVLLNMDKTGFAKILRTLDDEHKAADDAATSVASAYGKMKKQGVNLDALRLVRKLHALGNIAKVTAFLVDFDRMRELAGFDDQLALFDSEKTGPQKAAEDNVVQHPAAAKAKAEKPAKAAKPSKVKKQAKGAIPDPPEVMPQADAAPVPSKMAESQPASRTKLFSEGEEEVAEISAEEKARQAGLVSGKLGEPYSNPHAKPGPERDAWHAGWVEGDEARDAAERTAQKSA